MSRYWLPNEVVVGKFDEAKKHRFYLACSWDNSLERVAFVMLNPSWANEEECDDTIRKCIHYAKKMNCGSIKVINLFSLITPKPEDILNAKVKTKPENNYWIEKNDNG